MHKLQLKMKRKLKKKYLKSKLEECYIFLNLNFKFDNVNERLKLNCDSLEHYLSSILSNEYYEIKKYLNDFKILKFLNWKDSLSKKIKKTYLYEGVYPTILVIAYIFLLFIFTYVFYPSIGNVITDLNGSEQTLKPILTQMKFHWFMIGFIILSIILFVYLFRNNDLRVLIYSKLHNLKIYENIKIIWTYNFVLYYKILYEEGLDTKTIFELIKDISCPLSAFWLSYHIDLSFQNGTNWKVKYLDEFFVIKMEQSIDRKTVLNTLNEYLVFAENQINRKFNVLIKIIKGGICLCLIMMITLYYQTLYLPLTIFQTM